MPAFLKSADPRVLGLLLAVLTGLTWSVLSIAIKFAVQVSDAFTISAFRFLFSAGVLAVVFLFREPARLSGLLSLPRSVLLAGLALAANYIGFVYGIQQTNASYATVAIQLGPLLLALLGVFLLRTPLRPRQKIGLAAVFVGFAIYAHDQIGRQRDLELFQQGNLWLVFAAVTWVLWAWIQRRLTSEGRPAQQLNLAVFLLCAALLAPMAHWSSLGSLSVGDWFLMVFLGLNTLVSYGALAWALKLAPVHEVSLIISFYPLVTLGLVHVLDRLHWGNFTPEPLGLFGAAGAILALTGIVRTIGRA